MLPAPDLSTVAQALRHARAMGIDRLDAQLLVAHQLRRPRTWVVAHDDAALDAADGSALAETLRRRAAGEPLAYLVGEREFHGLSLHVTSDVLVPRPETEILVDWGLKLLVGRHAPRVLDLGTGSGAIALAIKHARHDSVVHASDRSSRAVAVARRNGERHALAIDWIESDWWRAIDPALRFDLVVSNPPYIAAGDPHLADLQYEPRDALVAPHAGLAAIEHIVAEAPLRLARHGWLAIEHGAHQADAVCECLLLSGFTQVQTHLDLAGRSRVSGGVMPASPA